MKGDAFHGGVAPGGLWNKNDIRILICYVLRSVGKPLSGGDIRQILLEKQLANYFEAGDALEALRSMGNVEKDEQDFYTLTDGGRHIAENLDTTLPLSVRDKALEAALTMLARAKAERENRVEITETEKGFRVDCHISGGEIDLMTVSLYVPDRAQAELVRERFFRSPGKVYRMLLAGLTGDDAVTKDILSELDA